MSAAWYWARTELRRHWRAWLSIAVLVGIGGGLAMASLAAARRTDTAYPRFLEQARPPDFVLDPDFEVDSTEFLDAVESLPAVALRSDARAVALGPVVDGRIAFAGLGNTVASVDGVRFYQRDRVHLVDGRMPDPSRADEVLVSRSAAADGLAVGDRLTYGALHVGDMFSALESGRAGMAVEDALATIDVEVTGVGIFPEAAVTEEALVPDVVMLTPALFRTLPEESHLWSRTGIHLVPGADTQAVKREIRELAASLGGDTLFEDRTVITDRAQRAIRPYVLALTGLGAAGALFVALLATQLVRRTVGQVGADCRVLVALSAGPKTVRAGRAMPAVVVAGVAAAVALAVQATVSRWSPVGPVAAIEPEPGVDLDWAVTGPGLAVLVAVCLVPALAVRSGSVTARVPRGSLATWAAQAGGPLPLTLGIGRAFGEGDRSRRSTARSGLVAVAVAITMLVAVATFATSLAHVLENPEVHGWNADVGLLGAGGYGSFDVLATTEVDGVESLTGGTFGTVGVEDASIPGVGLLPLRGELLPPVLDGRSPTGPGEIALGRGSLAEVGAAIGDVVDVRIPGEEPAAMTIVGTTVLPGLGQIDADRPSLGIGAYIVLPRDAVRDVQFSLVLADLEPEADPDVVTAELIAAADEQAGETAAFQLFRPADIDAFAEVGVVPLALVALFGAVALASLIHVLLVTTRAWRRDRAVLAALGATPGQLRSTLRWQSLVVVGLASAVALPVGSVVGRWSWRSLADEIGIVSDPVVPSSALVALVAVLVAVALLLTAVLEPRAVEVRPVDRLRTE